MSSKGTAQRHIRISDELWSKAKAQAQRDDTDVSSLIRTWLTVYVRPRAPRPGTARHSAEYPPLDRR